ncbi:MAG: MFS transporter [Alphaproteobacteria bacterium]|jgi:PAT family beta-lactamase induction signal transducer AmpG|nr:MFS transporter [Alphaproteobacteria bacterium]MBP9876715.1 MFS transporter [Alphaproteobacteria bacterium]
MFNYLKVYKDPRLLAIAFLGISSGFPLILVGATLDRWLVEEGLSKTGIGLFSFVALPYMLKFLWAPLMDHIHLPYFAKRFGQRRSWCVLSQIGLFFSVVLLGTSDPANHIFQTAFFALLVAFFNASQDIVIEAFRVESLSDRQQAAGAANIVLGYRIGMLISGAGALYMAEFLSWQAVYSLVACVSFVGMITIFYSKEPEVSPDKMIREESDSMGGFLKKAVILPFADFMKKPCWVWLLLLIVLYKVGEVLLAKMAMPFYTEIGFSKTEIASVSKFYGLFATIIGGLIGGAIASRFGILRSMMICGIPQMLTNLLYVLLAYIGYDLKMLMIAVTLDNLTAGMATACLVALMSRLCTKGIAASQYALFSSFTGISHKYFGAFSGYLADHMAWTTYFLITTFACLPGLCLLGWLMVRNHQMRFLPVVMPSAETKGPITRFK